MTEVELIDLLKSRLQVTLKDIYHPTDPSRGREQTFKAPQIVEGYLPPKRSGETEEDFPLVIVRPHKWRTEDSGGIVTDMLDVKILVGSYGSDSGDFKYTLNIWRRILNDLRQKPWLNDVYRMRRTIEAEMPDEQARDIYYLEAITTWELPTPQEVEKDDGYEPDR
tara:strand:- start:11998 stop:12495 length:498 start_codon:yes stop_codon:yes gene_type:complete